MLMFRPQRGGLSEAMAEAIEVGDNDHLMKHLQAIHPNFGPVFDGSRVKIEPYCEDDDDRIGWSNIRIVTDQIGVVGFLGDVK